jgi:hypothetical protein
MKGQRKTTKDIEKKKIFKITIPKIPEVFEKNNYDVADFFFKRRLRIFLKI